MNNHLLMVPLADLKTVRVICDACHTAVEIDVDRLALMDEEKKSLPCPADGCEAGLKWGKAELNPLRELAEAIKKFGKYKSVQVQFIIPEPAK